jgi:3-oxoacyl-[acyl-carrier protein] reductase
VNYASDRAGADRFAAEIVGRGGKAVAVQGDVSKDADVKRLFAEAARAFGRLDVLVNNAGVYRFGPFESISEEEFHRHYNPDVLGPILAVQEALKHFGSGGGSVINISSIVGTAPWAQATLYSSTKAAVDNLTRGLALELAPRKVRVNAVAPGTTESEGTSDLHLFEGDAGKKVIASTPLGRLGTPADIARVVVFLASDDSAWVTGEIIRAPGGLK